MPSSDISSAWDDLSREDFTFSGPSKTHPVSPTSPSSSSRPRQQALGKDSPKALSIGFARLALDPVGTQGQQVRHFSGGSVDSGGSSAWGTLASKSILSEVPPSGDKKLRGGKKVNKVENVDQTEDTKKQIKKEQARGPSSNKGKSRELQASPDVSRNAEPGRDSQRGAQQGPHGTVHQNSVSPEKRPEPVEAVRSLPTSQATSLAGEQPRKAKSKRGKKNRNKAMSAPWPTPADTGAGTELVPSSTKATTSDYSLVDSLVPTTTFDAMTDLSIAEMVKRNRANKDGKRPERQDLRDAPPGPAVQDDLNPADLTVTEMKRLQASLKHNIKRKEQRARQKERQKAEKAQARADGSTIKPADRRPPPQASTGSVIASNQTDDTFRSQDTNIDGITTGSSFRMGGRASYTSRGTTGTAEDSGVVVPRRPVKRGGKQVNQARESATTSKVQPHAGPGSRLTGLAPSSALHTKTSNTNTFYYPSVTARSTTTESVAPHHSISRRGSIHGPSGPAPESPASAIIIGLEGLSVGEAPAGGPAGIQPVLKRDAPPSQSSLRVPGFAQRRAAREPAPQNGPGISNDLIDARSITSYEEAHSSVRAFLVQDQTFLGDERNRLAFWQGLCIEVSIATSRTPRLLPDIFCPFYQFGLALSPSDIEAALARDSGVDPEYPPHSPFGSVRFSHLDTPTRYMLNLSPLSDDDSDSDFDDMSHSQTPSKRRTRARSGSDASDHTALQGDESRSSTPRAFLPVVPSTSRACLNMLKTQAHVNLYDWWIVRGEVDEKEKEYKRLGRAIGPAEEEEIYAPLRALVFPSASQMIRSAF
jgi:hypothetical protein